MTQASAPASALAGTDPTRPLALFKRAVDLSAGSGAADLELQRLWAEVAIEVGIPDAQTRPVIDSVIAATADDDPGAMAFALAPGVEAATHFYQLQGVVFDDGTQATGAFVYDDVSKQIVAWNVSVQGNGAFLPFASPHPDPR